MLLQSGRARTVAELTAELGVSRRTLFRDMKLLEAAGVPYFHEPGQGYRIARSFFLPPINLTVLETLGLMLQAKQVAAQDGKPLSDHALSAINKLTATVPEPIRSACNELMSRVGVSPPQAASSRGEDALYSQLQRCMDEGRACRFRYNSRQNDEPSAITGELEPYAIHYVGRAWYVWGRSTLHKDVRVFKLARFAALEPLSRRFDPPANFSVERKLGKAWQMIPEGKVYNIELLFDPKVAANVSEVRWHPTQKADILDDGRCRMTFEIDGLNEISWWLCGYADQVEIVKPVALRRKVGEMLKRAADRHAE